MLLIGSITELHQKRTNTTEYHTIDHKQLMQREEDIRTEIQQVQRQAIDPPFENNETRSLVHAATIYLHLVTRGFKYLEIVQPVIGNIQDLLAGAKWTCLSTNIFALFMVACITGPEGEPAARYAISAATPPLLPTFRHRMRFLAVVEEIWVRRRISLDLAWVDVLDLTADLILL